MPERTSTITLPAIGKRVYQLRQEASNLWLWTARPRHDARQAAPLRGLPDPDAVADQVRGSPFAAEIERLAGQVLDHEIPLLGFSVRTGPDIDWRRDYVHDAHSGLLYFRFVPYLDFSRVGDHKIVWELNRHQHLVLLAQAYRITRREEFCSEIRRQLDSWFAANPHMQGINWASALEVAFRALSWTWVYHLAGDALGEATRGRLLGQLRLHALYIERNLSRYFSPNTHLLGEAVALHAVGRLFPCFPEAARWERAGARLAAEQMASQICPDGSHFERSAYYHVYALDMFLFHQTLAETTPEFRRRLGLMADYLAALAGKTRRLPMLGDDDGGRLFHPYGPREGFARATLATSAVLLDKPELPYQSEDLHEQALWWLGPAVLGRRPRPDAAPARSAWYPDAGIALMPAGEAEVIVRAGSFGRGTAGHSHADCLSLIVRLGREEILVDPGTYTYISNPRWRDWFRGTAAHNTVRVDHRDQAVSAGPFRWKQTPEVRVHAWTSAPERDFLDAVCRYAGIAHRRRVLLLRPHLLFVFDQVEGAPGEHLLEQFWHFGEPARAASPVEYHIGLRTRLVLEAGARAELSTGGAHGWRSAVYGQKCPAPVLCVRRRGSLPAGFWSVLDFSGAGGPAALETETTGGGLTCMYSRGIFRIRVTIGEPLAPRTPDVLSLS